MKALLLTAGVLALALAPLSVEAGVYSNLDEYSQDADYDTSDISSAHADEEGEQKADVDNQALEQNPVYDNGTITEEPLFDETELQKPDFDPALTESPYYDDGSTDAVIE